MKTNHRNIMKETWNLARKGAVRFGDGTGCYFREALRIVWRECRDIPVYKPGLGTQFWMGFVPHKQEGRRGQVMLPGLSAK